MGHARNGYAFIYVSNRSDQDVYFDNLTVGIAAGNIIEENHYYAYGLKIAGLSSKKLGDVGEGKLKNPYQYNNKEMLDEDADLGWLAYGFREYDSQIGRFIEVDPLADDYPVLSPYLYAYNDPIANVDVAGLFGGVIGETAETAKVLTSATVVGYKAAKSVVQLSTVALSITKISIEGAVVACDIINNSITTEQIGGINMNIQVGHGYSTIDGKMWKMTETGDMMEAFMATGMKVSSDAVEFIKKEEQLGKKNDNIYDTKGKCIITCAYEDPSHYATIGYGHLIEKARYDRNKPSHVKWDNGLTPNQALELLGKDIADEATTIQRQITVPLTQSEYDGLVIAKFNGGYGEILKNQVNSLDYTVSAIYKAFLSRTRSGTPSRVMPGLVARRAEEASIFLFNIFNSFRENERKQWIKKWTLFSK